MKTKKSEAGRMEILIRRKLNERERERKKKSEIDGRNMSSRDQPSEKS